MNPPKLDRRSFLKTSALALGAGLAARAIPSTWAQPIGANGDLRIAVIGCGGKGNQHIGNLLKMTGVRLVALCDVDPRNLAQAVEHHKVKVFATTDARKLLARDDIDAVVIAAPNHWHALLMIWACQAGKDVYVEKPVSRTVWEGGKMIEAAEKYGRVVQSGTQFRSDPAVAELKDYLQEGHLGKIQWIHALSDRGARGNIGRKLPWYPDWLDYDLYCGSTPMVPLTRPRLQYDWHWVWTTGDGDIVNNGVHVFDIARNIAGFETMPRRIMSFGGRFARDDVAETPNMQVAVYDYPEFPIYSEALTMPAKPGVWYTNPYRQIREGVVVQCEGGYFSGYGSGAVYDKAGKQIKRFHGDSGAGHMANFLAAVRSRRTQDLAAPIQTGHKSSSLDHHTNISYRCGRPAKVAEVQKALTGFPEALETLDRVKAIIAANEVDLEKHPLTLGPWLEIGPSLGTIAGMEGGDPTSLDYARFLLRDTQRAPFIIPEQV